MGYYYYKIIKCKPGITGLWQVSERSRCSFNKRLEIDMEYCETKSITREIKIFLKTIKKVFLREDAV